MKRVIYSIYVDVPAKEHFGKLEPARIGKYDKLAKARKVRTAFKKHYNKLLESKQRYSKAIGVPFLMYEYDKQYQTFEKNLLKDFPEITGYEVVNFYKIHLLCQLAKEYDEILYLDFDAIPVTKDSFFDAWDLSKGICVYHNNHMVNVNRVPIDDLVESTRSPSAKYYNCQAMLLEKGHQPDNDVINTGIIGARKEDILKLNYFGEFKDIIDLMTKLKDEKDGMYPSNITKMFRYDNETIFSYKLKTNNVNVQWFDNKWHYFFDRQHFIEKGTKIVHAVCKEFDVVWRFDEKHNL